VLYSDVQHNLLMWCSLKHEILYQATPPCSNHCLPPPFISDTCTNLHIWSSHGISKWSACQHVWSSLLLRLFMRCGHHRLITLLQEVFSSTVPSWSHLLWANYIKCTKLRTGICSRKKSFRELLFFWLVGSSASFDQINLFHMYKGQSNENGSPHLTLTAQKLVTLEFAYGMNIWWGLGKAQWRALAH
jgi:hypothetical protein